MGIQGIRVVMACAGINLALGVFHSWHVARTALLQVLVDGGAAGVTPAALDDLYWVACLAYAFSMILAGCLLEEIGPRTTVVFGGVLGGLGFLLVAITTSYVAWLVGFGVLAGTGLGFCHAATIPTALRWFPRTRTGLISGVVVSGYGLAALYVTPLTNGLVAGHGVQNAMFILGTGFLVVVAVLSQLLAVPSVRPTLFAGAGEDDRAVGHLLRSSTTWLLWTTFFVGAGAGLMVGGLLNELAQTALGGAAFVAIVVMAIAGTGGRIAVGAVSDRCGRPRTLTALLAAQAVLMLAAAAVSVQASPPAAVVLALIGLVAFNYGGNFSLFPALTRDRFGLRNLGLNYGVIFTAWGVGGFAMTKIAGALHASTQSHRPACLLASVMLLCGSALSQRLQARTLVAAGKALASAPDARSAS